MSITSDYLPIRTIALVLLVAAMTPAVNASPIVTINSKTFDLAQFAGATVTYRADGGVTFDGKLWDNEVGVDLYTLGELASGQFGSDPGDQVSLNDRTTPDWLQLNYGTGQAIVPGSTEFVVFEITSATSSVDVEGLSWKVGFNGGTPVAVSASDVSFFAGPNGVENTNMAVLDLLDFGFSLGDTLNTVYIENIDSGSGTSDPDFIFGGITVPDQVPEPASAVLLGIGSLLILRRRRRG
jgi:PEP-CTERM motif